jgi:alkanesulfonate monooxygenase SsuD/methylene tetrahydromethanopterin reductase-like flavin-dependent oxidoreductase (luciferase family)
MSRQETRMFGPNKFKLGLFGMNCSGGLTMTKAPEYWDPSWENNVAAARLADEAGLEFLLPIGRWHGYRGETDTEGTSFETITWAAGLLAATEHITAFGTVHVALISPVFAAKQMVTADHIGKGRFGLNIVSGWNEGEHGMFGIGLRDHEARYAYSEEWISIVKRIWAEEEPFDFAGEYFDLKGVISKPKPYGGDRPLLVSAGTSPVGRAFAARHADCLFMAISELELLGESIGDLRALGDAHRTGVYASGHLVTRPSAKEAADYYHYIVHDMGDWEAAEYMLAIRTKGKERQSRYDKRTVMLERMISGVGTFPVVGSYDEVAEAFKFMCDCGLDGMAIGLVNYIDDMPAVRDEVLPRMERLGLRG